MPVALRVHDDDAGQRVDRFLRKLLPRAPLSLVHRLLRQGAVRVDGRKVEGSHRLSAGDDLELMIDAERLASLTSTERPAKETRRTGKAPFPVVFEDAELLVVDKPAGLAVHGGTGLSGDHLVSRVRDHVEASGARTFRPAPAHRIDRATSGLCVIGKTAQSLRALTAAFRENRVRKTYVAVVHGRPKPPNGTIEVALRVHEDGDARAPKSAPDADAGLAAITRYRTRRTRQGLSLVEARIETGRTHQIRAHLASRGCPIVGDARYGAPERPSLGAHRIALHAAELVLEHPVDGRELVLRAPVPPGFDALLDQRGGPASPTASASARKRRP